MWKRWKSLPFPEIPRFFRGSFPFFVPRTGVEWVWKNIGIFALRGRKFCRFPKTERNAEFSTVCQQPVWKRVFHTVWKRGKNIEWRRGVFPGVWRGWVENFHRSHRPPRRPRPREGGECPQGFPQGEGGMEREEGKVKREEGKVRGRSRRRGTFMKSHRELLYQPPLCKGRCRTQ